jgi:small-conductance mechanosensitive channel
MADDKKEDKAPQETQGEDKPKTDESAENAKGEEKLLGKFKTEQELAESYKELESKLGEQGEEVRQAREFAQVVQPLLEEIRDDPELFKQLEERLEKRTSPTADTKAKANGDEKTAQQEEMRAFASDTILAKFEERHGIDKLSTDERKALKQKIGSTVKELTGKTIDGIDLRRLESVLNNAYILANKDDLVSKSKLEALASDKEVDEASFPSIPSSPGKGEPVLTAEETRVAEKMGLTGEQYLEGKKS